MRLLFTAVPEVGHIVPLLGLAAVAQAAGHEVRLATHPSAHAVVKAGGLEPVAAGLSTAEVDTERRRRWPETVGRPATEWGVRMWVHIAAPAMAADLRAILERWRPAAVIHEEGEYAGGPTAAAAGLPWITFGWGSPGRPSEELEWLGRQSQAAGLWCGSPRSAPHGGHGTYALIDPCPALLDPGSPRDRRVWPIQPHVLHERSPKTPQPGRNYCYIGFGTTAAFAAPAVMAEAAQAALAAGLEVVATTADASLAARLTDAGVDVRSFVSLPELLPACRLVVTHGGAGTTLASLSYGIPLVVAPQGAPSQERMAVGIDRAGVGRAVRGPSEVAGAIRAVTTEDRFARAAGRAAGAIAAMPDPSSVLHQIEAMT